MLNHIIEPVKPRVYKRRGTWVVEVGSKTSKGSKVMSMLYADSREGAQRIVDAFWAGWNERIGK